MPNAISICALRISRLAVLIDHMKSAIAVLIICILACDRPPSQTARTQQPDTFWTPTEETEYKTCISETSGHFGHTVKEVEDYCLVNEEHKRWLRNHPEVAGKEEIKGAWDRCMERNKAKINGTRDEFRNAFDGCMSEGYGLQ